MQWLHALPWPLLLGPPGAAALRPGSGRPSSPCSLGFQPRPDAAQVPSLAWLIRPRNPHTCPWHEGARASGGRPFPAAVLCWTTPSAAVAIMARC